jgi:hypothetical protein
MTIKAYFLTTFIAFYSTLLLSQNRFDTIRVYTKDIVYDVRTDKIYASIPSINGSNGNSIGIVNPRTIKLEKTIFMGLDPTVISLSDDGKYIYSGFSGEPIVRRFEVATQTAGLRIGIGKGQFGAGLYAKDIATLPKKSTAFAVSRMDIKAESFNEGVAILDNDTIRPDISLQGKNVNKMQFLNDSIFYGYENQTSECKFGRYALTSSGIIQRNVVNGVPRTSCFGLNFTLNNGKVYFTEGTIIDVLNSPIILGRINRNASPVVYDAYKNLVCFASTDINGLAMIQRYNPETFLLYDVIQTKNIFPNGTIGIGRLITCGNDCYAFNYATEVDDFNNIIFNHILIVRTPTSGIQRINEGSHNIIIYPNPATESIDIQSVVINYNWTKFAISNINGSIVLEGKKDSNEKINITELSKGIYFLHLTDTQNEKFYGKFIKN